MKLKHLVPVIFCFLSPILSVSQHHGSFEKNLFITENDTLPYRLLLPMNYNPSKKYAFILFLHGAGERGNNNASQLNHGGSLFTADRTMENYPAIVVFPQCSAKSRWSNVEFRRDSSTGKRFLEFPPNLPPTTDMKLLIDLVRQLEKKYPIDKTKMYVGGLSLGGMGTFDIVNRMPNTFAAAFPICGGANDGIAGAMKNTSWWIFHGQKDSTVFAEYSKAMASALKKAGADVRLTIYPEAGHNSWDNVFKEPGLLPWIFSKSLKGSKN